MILTYFIILTGNAEGVFALTSKGNIYFRNLEYEQQFNFLFQLRLDLTQVISVDPEQLGQIQLDKIIDYQITLILPIKATANKFERNALDLINDLNLLIRNKDLTMIS